jgi:hypothetical protein
VREVLVQAAVRHVHDRLRHRSVPGKTADAGREVYVDGPGLPEHARLEGEGFVGRHRRDGLRDKEFARGRGTTGL